MRTVVIGWDLSLTRSGISDGTRHETIETHAGELLRSRANAIVQRIAEFVRPHLDPETELLFVVEAPMLREIAGGSHLFEVGWLMGRFDSWIAQMIHRGVHVRDLHVPTSTMRKALFGKGNIPTNELALKIFRTWGVAIEQDRGNDKAVAYCMHRYGLGVEAGTIAHVPSAPRGKGNAARAAVRRRGAA